MILEDTNFCFDLIGRAWESGARGPKRFDCWGLLRYVYQERRGIDLPPFEGLDACDTFKVVRAIKQETGSTWKQVMRASHLCAVGLSSGKSIHHVGIWLETDGGGVLHCSSKSGVVFQKTASLRQTGIQHITFYKLQKS